MLGKHDLYCTFVLILILYFAYSGPEGTVEEGNGVREVEMDDEIFEVDESDEQFIIDEMPEENFGKEYFKKLQLRLSNEGTPKEYLNGSFLIQPMPPSFVLIKT